MIKNLKHIIESLLFVSEDPLTLDRIKRVIADSDTAEIRDALRTLFDEYRDRDGGFYLSEVAGGYQFRTQPDYNPYIRRMLKPNAPRLSKAALETLAIIAYKQPVIRSDVEHIRGVDCGGILRTLLERKLVRILGRKEIPGRPLIYATTKLFLEVFDLKNLKDLPTPKEIEEMSASPLEKEMDAFSGILNPPAETEPETAAGDPRKTDDTMAEGASTEDPPAPYGVPTSSTESESEATVHPEVKDSQTDEVSTEGGSAPSGRPKPPVESAHKTGMKTTPEVPDSPAGTGEKKLDAR